MATAVEPPENPTPFKEQEPFLWDTQRYYTYASGVGSGKTAVGLMRAALNVDYWNPGYMGAIIAPTSTMIKNAIFPLMREFGIRDKWDYKGPQAEQPGFQAPNGSRILILSADNERTIERLAGLNLSWWWVDEARDVPERALQILIQRLRKGNYKNGFLTSTPRKNHLEDFALKGAGEPYRHGDAYIYEGDDRLAITGVTPDSNPYMSKEDIEAIEDAHPSGLMEQEVKGRFIEISGGIFTPDMFNFVHKSSINPDWNLKTIIAIDPAATMDAQKAESDDSDYWAATVVQASPRKERIWVTDTARKRGMTLKQGCEWIGQIASSAKGASVICEANKNQRWLVSELKDYGVYADPIQTTRNKEEKLVDLTIPMENGTIEFVDWNADTPEDAGNSHPYGDLVEEMLAFPEGSHDDLPDSLYMACNYAPVSLGSNIMSANPYKEDENDGDYIGSPWENANVRRH
jgi:phage terminase large subunit-like protein